MIYSALSVTEYSLTYWSENYPKWINLIAGEKIIEKIDSDSLKKLTPKTRIKNTKSGNHYMPYPADETKYIMITPDGLIYVHQCFPGLVWNDQMKHCYFPSQELSNQFWDVFNAMSYADTSGAVQGAIAGGVVGSSAGGVGAIPGAITGGVSNAVAQSIWAMISHLL